MQGFTEREQDAWGGFLGTYAHIYLMIEADLIKNASITHAELEVLLRLWLESQHRMQIQELAARSLLTLSGMSRLLSRMEKAGLIQREVVPTDRRSTYAVLTRAGIDRFEHAAPGHIAFVKANFLSHFNEHELDQMASFWKRLDTEPHM